MFDTRLTFWNRKRKLLVVDHRGRNAAKIEIDACKSRIRRGEGTHIEIEAISSDGAEYIDELREFARG